MSDLTGKKLLESFLDGRCPVVPHKTDEVKIRFPVPKVDNPRKDVVIPENMSDLTIDSRGYRVPYFVAWIDGKPDFRCVRRGVVSQCIRQKLCWICGKPHIRETDGTYLQTYVIGSMCAVNHISAEPGSHFDCARYSVQVCPFLSAPRMRRNEKDLPEGVVDPGGLFIRRNPGVILLWTTAHYQLTPAGQSVLFRIGSPTHVEAWREGRRATRNEVMESIRTGLPILQEEAKAQGPMAEIALVRMTGEATLLLDRFIS